jgi:DNA-binding NtrC family response regulator
MIQILMIEDDLDYAMIVHSALAESLGDISITSVEQGAEALALEWSAFDVVLLDNNLPDMSGLEILQKSADKAHVPIIMITGDSHIETAVEALKAGAEDFVIKSLDLERLLPHIVQRAITNFQQRRAVSEIEMREHERKVQLDTLKRIMMTLAHHLNNAVMPITFSAELCERCGYDSEATERLVKTCLSESKRIIAIIDRFEQYVEFEEFKYTDYLDLKNAMFEV